MTNKEVKLKIEILNVYLKHLLLSPYASNDCKREFFKLFNELLDEYNRRSNKWIRQGLIE